MSHGTIDSLAGLTPLVAHDENVAWLKRRSLGGLQIGVFMTGPPSTALGLKRGTVALAEYSPSWRKAFREERAVLAKALASAPCEIEHIGSTAVTGLEAKPILDIAVRIKAPYPIAGCIPTIEATGYIYRGEDVDIGHLFVQEAEEDVRTHHLHVVSSCDPNWERWLTFRDYLRANPDAREAYAAEKTRLAIRYKENRVAYTEGKSQVIGSLLAQARGV